MQFATGVDASIELVTSAVGYWAAVYLVYRGVLAWLRTRWARYAYPTVDVGRQPSEWQQRCRGILLGLAVGDAVNLPAESLPRWLVRLRYRSGPSLRRGILRFARQAGDVSDDTQLTICVARSIGPDGVYNHQRFVDELAQWSYFRVGAGRASSRAATRARHGRDPTGEPSEGNGVAIRIAPLAIALAYRSDEELARQIERNGRATHTSDAAIRGAVFVAFVLKQALQMPRRSFDDPGALARVIEEAVRHSGFDLGLVDLDPPTSDADLQGRLQKVGTSGHVYQSVVAAMLVLLRHRLDLSAAMHAVFQAGGDTDSMGAIVGAIIGAQVGEDNLPRVWAAGVQHRDYLCWLADRLATPVRDAAKPRGEVVKVYGNVATRPVDVVVNAWNRNAIAPWLLLPQGVSKAIRRAGGRQTIREVGRRAPLPLGSATETRAGRMTCHWVVHVAGINLLWRASETSVRDATRNALALCRWLGARTVAVPLIGAGSGGLRDGMVEEIVRDELERQREHFERLELVVYS